MDRVEVDGRVYHRGLELAGKDFRVDRAGAIDTCSSWRSLVFGLVHTHVERAHCLELRRSFGMVVMEA